MSVNIKINGQTIYGIHAVQFENADAPGTNIQFYDVNSVQEEKTVTPTTSVQEVVPSSEKLLSKVTVEGVTAEVDSNIQAQNIKEGVSILGVTGQYQTPSQEKSVSPTTSEQEVTPDSGKLLSKVTVGGVTSSIDSNITAGNIKHGVEILGVVGTYGSLPPISEITDLTGTAWVLNESLSPMESISIGMAFTIPINESVYSMSRFSINYGSPHFIGSWATTNQYSNTELYSFELDKYYNGVGREVFIAGGTGATDSRVVQWFKNNATLIGVMQQ